MAIAKVDAARTTSSDENGFPSVWDDGPGRHMPDHEAFNYVEPDDPYERSRHWHHYCRSRTTPVVPRD